MARTPNYNAPRSDPFGAIGRALGTVGRTAYRAASGYYDSGARYQRKQAALRAPGAARRTSAALRYKQQQNLDGKGYKPAPNYTPWLGAQIGSQQGAALAAPAAPAPGPGGNPNAAPDPNTGLGAARPAAPGTNVGGGLGAPAGSAPAPVDPMQQAYNDASGRVNSIYDQQAAQIAARKADMLAQGQQIGQGITNDLQTQIARAQQQQAGVDQDLANQGVSVSPVRAQAAMEVQALTDALSRQKALHDRILQVTGAGMDQRAADLAGSRANVQAGMTQQLAALQAEAAAAAAGGGGGGGGSGGGHRSGSKGSSGDMSILDIMRAGGLLKAGQPQAQSGLSWLQANYKGTKSGSRMAGAYKSLKDTKGGSIGALLQKYGGMDRYGKAKNPQLLAMLQGFQKQRNAYHKPQGPNADQMLQFAQMLQAAGIG